MDITIAFFIICLLIVLLFFAYRFYVLYKNLHAEREDRTSAIEESNRKVLEQYRNKYLNALEKYASNKEMENFDKNEFLKYINAVKILCELPEKKDGKVE